MATGLDWLVAITLAMGGIAPSMDGVPIHATVPPYVNNVTVGDCILISTAPTVAYYGVEIMAHAQDRKITVRLKPDVYDALFDPSCEHAYLMKLEVNGERQVTMRAVRGK